MAVIGLGSLTACGGGIDKDKGYNDITSKLTLNKDYAGKNFFDDGIGLVEVLKLTDGDTTTFTLPTPSKDGRTSVVIRYHGIDTPESTIDVQKWGKSASKYNASRLANAYQVVVEGVYKTSETANQELSKTGERYLGYVWYRNSETDTFKNLNCEMVENGYTDVVTPIADYRNRFDEAKKFAKDNELHIWSNDEDPNYSPDPITTTVEEIKKDLDSLDPKFYSLENEVGAKVMFKGTILSHTENSTHYYTIGEIGSDGKLYTMNMFAGYTSAPINSSRYLTIGSTYHVVATIQKYNGKYQISGIIFSIGKTDDSHTHLVSSNDYIIFDNNHEAYSDRAETGVKGDLVVQTAILENNTLKLVGTAKNYPDAKAQTYTVIVKNYSSSDVLSLVGKSISCSGFKNTDGNIELLSENDLKIR